MPKDIQSILRCLEVLMLYNTPFREGVRMGHESLSQKHLTFFSFPVVYFIKCTSLICITLNEMHSNWKSPLITNPLVPFALFC